MLPKLAELVTRIRGAGMAISDRRAVRLQRVIAASALLCGRLQARVSDLWVLKHIWDTEEQQEPLSALVQGMIDSEAEAAGDHPRARGGNEPDPEALARDLAALETDHTSAGDEAAKTTARDRLALLESRIAWVRDAAKRTALTEIAARVWKRFSAGAA